MNTSNLNRVSGLSLVIGALAFTVHIVLRSALTAGAEAAAAAQGALWVPVNALGFLGAMAVLLGTPAVYARMAATTGPAALAGIVLIAVSWTFFGVFLSLYATLLMPWLAEKAPDLVAAGAPLPAAFLVAFLLALLGWLAGAVLLALPFLRGRLRPRWIGWLLPLSALWMVVGNLVIAPSGPESDLALNLISNLGPVLLAAALGYLGFRLFSVNGPD